jgi:hypothetical protein
VSINSRAIEFQVVEHTGRYWHDFSSHDASHESNGNIDVLSSTELLHQQCPAVKVRESRESIFTWENGKGEESSVHGIH